MKYVINEQFGGFGLSQDALQFLIKEKGWKIAPPERCVDLYHSGALKLIDEGFRIRENDGKHLSWLGQYSLLDSDRELSFRSDLDVIEAVEVLGDKANGRHATLVIKDVPYTPEDNRLEIHDYDGNETLQTIPERF